MSAYIRSLACFYALLLISFKTLTQVAVSCVGSAHVGLTSLHFPPFPPIWSAFFFFLKKSIIWTIGYSRHIFQESPGINMMCSTQISITVNLSDYWNSNCKTKWKPKKKINKISWISSQGGSLFSFPSFHLMLSFSKQCINYYTLQIHV